MVKGHDDAPKPNTQGIWKRKSDGAETSNPFSILASSSGANIEDSQNVRNVEKSGREANEESNDEDINHVFDESTQFVAMSEFNAALYIEDMFHRSKDINISMREFSEFATNIEVEDVNCTDFMKVVADIWKMDINCYTMFKIVKRLRLMKKPLRTLLHDHGNIHNRVVNLRLELDKVEKALDRDPSLTNLYKEEAVYLAAFTQTKLDEQRFLKQKAKIDWLHKGDSNTAYFHHLVKPKGNRSHIDCILGLVFVFHKGNVVPNVFMQHYINFIRQGRKVHPLTQERIFMKRSSQDKADKMVRIVLGDEIRLAIFGIAIDKSLGLDGYTSLFFKKAWDIIGGDVFREDGDFTYHHKCSKLKIVNICFVDGLLLFARSDVHSTKIIMEALEEFKEVSGLVPSISKSAIFMCNVPENVKASILHLMPFERRSLDIKYLGVSLISSRLLYKDCKVLIERVRKHIEDWKNKWLSFVGIVQLVKSVLSSMHLYWASVFILPACIIHDPEKLMNGFFVVPRPHVWYKLGNRTTDSIWFNTWDVLCPSIHLVTPRAMSRAGYNRREKIADVVNESAWSWPVTCGLTADDLSVVASMIGNPLMLDSYKSTMCTDSWGRSSYARAMIEIDAENARNKGKKQVVVKQKPNIAFKQAPKLNTQGIWKRKSDDAETSNPFSVLASSSGANIEDSQNVRNVEKSGRAENEESNDEDIEHVLDDSTRFEKWASDSRFCTKGSRIILGWNDDAVDVAVLTLVNLRLELDEVQKALDRDPSSTNLHEEEAVYLAAFTHAKLDEQRFLNQKAIIDWLHESDSNTAYFHHLVKPKGRYQKAYDTVSWKFLENILWDFGFHPHMVQWIMACVTRTSFSININEDLHSYFCGKWGLHQGDPMYPYLFTLIMKILTLIVKRKVQEDGDFTYHHKCSKFKIVNICFVDGLLLFARGHVHSNKIIMEALEEFKEVLGLVPSISKSTIFMCNVSDSVKASILHLMPFERGSLPIKESATCEICFIIYAFVLGVSVHSPGMYYLLSREAYEWFFVVPRLRDELDEAQKAIILTRLIMSLEMKWLFMCKPLMMPRFMEKDFLSKKAKIEWLDVGDSNSAYFHKSIKSHNQRSHIKVITNSDNVQVTGNQIQNVFISHYNAFLGTQAACDELDSEDLFHKKVSDLANKNMTKPITNEKIKRAMFGIEDDKAPGPDGFTFVFFKKGWDVVGQDIYRAVRDFFDNGKLLKEVNHTFLALIPKVTTPLKVKDYNRPISCCNVIYKCISNILTNRIIEGIKEVVSDNQSAFVLGRRISDNILITQELMHNYHCDRGPPRYTFKVDIQKAYDTVDWCFLERILTCFGFHPNMIKWIMACVTSTSFSISINGDVHGFIKVRLSDSFRFHKNCEELNIINVFFTDDLFLFSRGDVNSAKVIMNSLDEFKAVSGLVPSIPKSTAYFCNVLNHVKIGILNIIPFSEGDLPVKYIGVPLISSRLLNKDCIIYDIQQLIHAFLWCNGEIKRGKAKVAWEEICLTKSEGGLGLRSIEIFNLALMTTHIWNIISNKESFCVGWIHTYKLRGRALWDIQPKVKLAWEALRPRDVEVVWHKTVWFSHCIPRYAFHLWLVMRRSLKTQDRLCPWDVAPSTDLSTLTCAFCKNQMDTHEHLFFECDYAAEVWSLVRGYAEMDTVQPVLKDIMLWFQPMGLRRTFQVMDVADISGISLSWNDIVAWLLPISKQNMVTTIVGRLLVAVSSYVVWQERDNRIHGKGARNADDVVRLIIDMVHLKLASIPFKRSMRVEQLRRIWKITSVQMDT
ncbi:protein LAZ1 [Tanacetum coccineum]